MPLIPNTPSVGVYDELPNIYPTRWHRRNDVMRMVTAYSYSPMRPAREVPLIDPHSGPLGHTIFNTMRGMPWLRCSGRWKNQLSPAVDHREQVLES